MTPTVFRPLGFAACLAVALPALAQVGHPAKGSWLGFWGPDEDEQRRILMLLDWEDNTITGTINPGRDDASIARAELDPSTWTLRLEADMPAGDGRERLVMTGTLENLGSWTNRRYSGTYRLGDETGDFDLSLN